MEEKEEDVKGEDQKEVENDVEEVEEGKETLTE